MFIVFQADWGLHIYIYKRALVPEFVMQNMNGDVGPVSVCELCA